MVSQWGLPSDSECLLWPRCALEAGECDRALRRLSPRGVGGWGGLWPPTSQLHWHLSFPPAMDNSFLPIAQGPEVKVPRDGAVQWQSPMTRVKLLFPSPAHDSASGLG